jgi:hypothetical protein
MRTKLESSDFSMFWMAVEDPVFSGDQVRLDNFGAFSEFINVAIFNP